MMKWWFLAEHWTRPKTGVDRADTSYSRIREAGAVIVVAGRDRRIAHARGMVILPTRTQFGDIGLLKMPPLSGAKSHFQPPKFRCALSFVRSWSLLWPPLSPRRALSRAPPRARRLRQSFQPPVKWRPTSPYPGPTPRDRAQSP